MTHVKNPSRKLSLVVAVLILLAGVFLGGYLVLKSGKVSAGQLDEILRGSSVSLTACQPDPNDTNKDSDDDGLKDWQEAQLYKTDACKADSDGDGYLDGEEALSGYDPTQKAPGDELPGTKPQTPRPLPANLTEALRQRLSTQLNENGIKGFDANGQLVSPNELESLPGVSQAAWDIIAANEQLFESETIDVKELNIIEDNSPTTVKNYLSLLGNQTFIRSAQNQASSEAELFLLSIQKNDPTLLDENLNNYQISYQRLKKMAVPSQLTTLHQDTLNIISTTIKIYRAIQDFDADPLKTSLALQRYSELGDQLLDWGQRLIDVSANIFPQKKTAN